MLSLVLVTSRKADFLFQGQDLGNGCRAITEHRDYPISILTNRSFLAGGGVAWRARTRAGAAPDRHHHRNTCLDSSQLASFSKRAATVDSGNSDCAWFSDLFSLILFGYPGVARTLCYTANYRSDRRCRYNFRSTVSYWPYRCSLVRCFLVGYAR